MKRLLLLAIALGLSVLPALSAGLIIVHEPDFWLPHPPPPDHWIPPRPIPPPRHDWAPLEIAYVRANVTVKEQIAVTSIEEEFYNPNPRQCEGTFLFPVPKGAQLNKFTMEINGKQVEAELLASAKARGIYEDIVRKLRDPALLEFSGQDLFKVRIFPIEPHGGKRITLSYSQVLKADAGMLEYVLPLNTAHYSAKPVRNLRVKLELESKPALKSIYSPSHKIEVDRHGDHQAAIRYEASTPPTQSDFHLLFSREEGEFGLTLLTSKRPHEDGYFLLLVTPSAEMKPGQVMPKDVAFILDVSGSMSGPKLEQAKKALLFCLENLKEPDRFEVVAFSTEVNPLFGKLVDNTPEHRRQAREFVRELKPIGGTAIEDALLKTLASRPDGERPFTVIFLTDGRPTIGTTDEDQILRKIKPQQKNTRIFSFGLGTDVNTHLLDKLSSQASSFSQYVLPEEDLELKLSSFFLKINEPVLANPRLVFPEGVRANRMYPSPLPDLFKGEQLVLVGRYKGEGSGKIVIEGSVNGKERSASYQADFPAEASDHDFIPRLWGTRRVGYLLDEIRLHGENKELKDEVTELARQYGIVTPYTAYLILEDEDRRGVPTAMRSVRLEENSPVSSGVLQEQYQLMLKSKDGAVAFAGARSSSDLKRADSAAAGIAGGQQHAFYGLPSAASTTPAPAQPALSTPAPGYSGSFRVNAPAAPPVENFVQQSRFVAGRTFYLNQGKWVESGVQKLASPRRVRVEFGSAEYFRLIGDHPEGREWFALGRQLELVLAGVVYEIYE